MTRKFFVLQFKFPSGLEMYFTDDFGSFALTPDIDSCVQWDQGDEAKLFFDEMKKSASGLFKTFLDEMKITPVGFN